MGISILHPYFTIAIIALIVISVMEFRSGPYSPKKQIWFVVAFLIVLAGFRNLMIDDRAYKDMYALFGVNLPYDISVLKENFYGIEWIYALYNKIIFSLGMPFSFLVFFTALMTVSIKCRFVSINSAYPALSFLLYMIPSYFTGDMAHMRQAVAIALVFLSYEAIKHRRLWLFLVLIYIANGFHNSSLIFLFAYWLVLLPMKKWFIISAVALCMVLSPFEVYNNISLLEGITPKEVMQDYQNYESIVHEETGKLRFNDILSMFYLFFILAFNEEAEEKIPYYEYMRNIVVVGICIYFIFRNSPIFSTRLVTYYYLFASIMVPSIIASVSSQHLRKYLYGVMLCFVVFYYFVFANNAGKKGFTPENYSNWLIGG
ncbi:EpsG family protein [Bergeyella sp. RCAD1439]|uniref:EpsG family protein n=1 Tax=Bergeyella anatis TaxID=3113737 RepID=UPI002E17A90B|nr:EpsG family protein [Bergeyella sp. RCAD1439]